MSLLKTLTNQIESKNLALSRNESSLVRRDKLYLCVIYVLV